MPTYTYRRADGSTFDIEQRITEDPLGTCPTTGQAVTRVITAGAGLVFKGSGFYLTDYARKSNGASDGDGAHKSTSDASSNGSADSGSSDASASSDSASSTSTSRD